MSETEREMEVGRQNTNYVLSDMQRKGKKNSGKEETKKRRIRTQGKSFNKKEKKLTGYKGQGIRNKEVEEGTNS
jgi:hypothetical protein